VGGESNFCCFAILANRHCANIGGETFFFGKTFFYFGETFFYLAKQFFWLAKLGEMFFEFI
jgi:hypothetical protein